MGADNQVSLEMITSKLQGCGMEMPLSKFVELNLDVLKEFKKYRVPLKFQANVVSKAINKSVSVASLSVALSRLNGNSNESHKIIIMEKKEPARFVDKEAKLILGSQTEKEKIIKNGVMVGFKDVKIDWRGLAPNESVSSWIIEYKDRLVAINHLGWRWSQIAVAINEHLSLQKGISANTLTSVISIANKKITINKQTNLK